MKVCVVTYLYPSAEKYLSEFVACLNEQSVQNFDLVVFNDGTEEIELLEKKLLMPAVFVNVSGSPTDIRLFSFDWLRNSRYKKIVFQDVDDLMSVNRVEVMTQLLDTYPIVSNDLTLMDEHGKVIRTSAWSDQLSEEFNFTYDFIRDKNIAGIGNSALKREVLETELKKSSKVIVADWFIFYQLMYHGKYTACFTNSCQTLYRQHIDNMAGVRSCSPERVGYVLKVKEAHYHALMEIGLDMKVELEKLQRLKQNLSLLKIASKVPQSFFWWDELNHVSQIPN